MTVEKAVVPIAGLGTRMWPTTRVIPKEMLPLGKLPVIQHVVEELSAAGLNQVLFVTNRNKEVIENHLDAVYDSSRLAGESGIRFLFTRQRIPRGQDKPMGTGDAIGLAEEFSEEASFVVAYGDSVIYSETGSNMLERLIAAHEHHQSACTLAVYQVPPEQTNRYGIVVPATKSSTDEGCALDDILEKPSPEQTTSRWAVSARYVLSHEIFAQLRRVATSPDGEVYITDAIRGLIRDGFPVRAVFMNSDERRFDIGSHRSYFQAFLHYALEDEECGNELLQAFGSRVLASGSDSEGR